MEEEKKNEEEEVESHKESLPFSFEDLCGQLPRK